ncbi:hypothetical protein P3S67_013115 [Capsicum chacoense]
MASRTKKVNGVAEKVHYRGVRKSPSGRYTTEISIAEKNKWLGTFDTANLAAMAYDAAII